MGTGETCSFYLSMLWISDDLSYAVKQKVNGHATINQGDVRLWYNTTAQPNKCTIYKKIGIPAPI